MLSVNDRNEYDSGTPQSSDTSMDTDDDGNPNNWVKGGMHVDLTKMPKSPDIAISI